MQRPITIQFGNRNQRILIYKVINTKRTLIDTEFTLDTGELRWMPPGVGTYDLINEGNPNTSIFNRQITSTDGGSITELM
jgi:hypothetical protein